MITTRTAIPKVKINSGCHEISKAVLKTKRANNQLPANDKIVPVMVESIPTHKYSRPLINKIVARDAPSVRKTTLSCSRCEWLNKSELINTIKPVTILKLAINLIMYVIFVKIVSIVRKIIVTSTIDRLGNALTSCD